MGRRRRRRSSMGGAPKEPIPVGVRRPHRGHVTARRERTDATCANAEPCEWVGELGGRALVGWLSQRGCGVTSVQVRGTRHLYKRRWGVGSLLVLWTRQKNPHAAKGNQSSEVVASRVVSPLWERTQTSPGDGQLIVLAGSVLRRRATSPRRWGRSYEAIWYRRR